MATIIFEEGHDKPKYASNLHSKKQLINNILDGMAKTRPNALYCEMPISTTSYEAGYRKVTYFALANAVNGIAWWLTKELGPGKDFPTICYMGWNDVRYVVVVLGAVKAGYKVLFNSPRNSNEGNKNLFKALDCKILAIPDPRPPTVDGVLDIIPDLKVITVPSTEELLTTSYEYFPYNKTFEAARLEPLLCLHTSGTTGLPKPVIYTHDFAAAHIRMTQLAPPEGYESMEKVYQGTRVFMLLPPFHSSSAFGPLMEGISNQTTIIYPLPYVLATAFSLVDILKHTAVDGICVPPIIVHQIATNPELLKLLSEKLDVIFFGGGDLPQTIGDIVSPKFKFWTSNGSTETAPYPLIRACGEWPVEDWKYNQIHPAGGLQFRRISQENHDLYEAVVVRHPDPELEQPVFKVYPDLKEYATKDLFSPHPTKDGLWTFRGRRDDMIQLSSGKYHTQDMNQAVASHPSVKDGLMIPVGKYFNDRFASKAGLLIELKDGISIASTKEKEKLLEEIWLIVDKINSRFATQGQIKKECILFADPERPLPRSPKGTIRRSAAMDLYARELEGL